MAPGNRKTKFSCDFLAALLVAFFLVSSAGAQTAPKKIAVPSAAKPVVVAKPTVAAQPAVAAPTVAPTQAPAVLEMGNDDNALNIFVALGPTASTAWGVGLAATLDVQNDAPFATGFYEGGFFPHIEIGAQAFPGTAPLYQFSLGAEFYSNLSGTNPYGLRNAWMHGYREIFRSNAVFLEGNFLGLIPFYFSGFHWRFPWGGVDVQWIPFEYLRATRDLMSFAVSGAQAAIQADLGARHFLSSRARLGILYLGFDGLYRTQSGAGFNYGLEVEYRLKFTKRLMAGTRLGIEGGLAGATDSRTAAVTGWSTFGFQSMLFVLRQF